MLAFVILGVIILVGFVFLMYKIVDYKRLYLQFKTLYDDLVLVVKTKLEVEINTLHKNVIDLTAKLNMVNNTNTNLINQNNSISDQYNALVKSRDVLQSQFDELYTNFTNLDNLFTQYRKENPIDVLEEPLKDKINKLSTTEILPEVKEQLTIKKTRKYKNRPDINLKD